MPHSSELEKYLIAKGNSSAFYRYVNGKLSFKSSVSTLKNINEVTLSDDRTIIRPSG